MNAKAGLGWRRVVWSAAGQGLSSVTNFGLGAGLAVSGSTADLGRAISAVSVYFLALTVGRAMFAESLVAATEASIGQWAWVRRRLLLLGAVSAPASAAVGWIVDLHGVAVAIIALAMVPLLVQDGFRYLAWNRGRPGRAAAIDGVWVTGSSMAVAVFWLTAAEFTVVTVTAAWAAGGLLSTAFAPLLVGRPDPTSTPREVGDRHRQLAYSQSISTASFNLAPVALAVLLTPEVAGLAKAVILPFAPWLSLLGGLRMVTLSAVTRWRLDPPAGSRSPALRQAAVLVPTSVVVGLGLMTAVGWTTDRVEPFRQAEPYLPFGVALCVCYVAVQVLSDGMALGPSRDRALRLRLATVVVEWVGLFGGALVGGPEGMLWGWTLALVLNVAVWLRSVTEPVPDAPRLDGCSPVRPPAPFPTPQAPISSRIPTAG